MIFPSLGSSNFQTSESIQLSQTRHVTQSTPSFSNLANNPNIRNVKSTHVTRNTQNIENTYEIDRIGSEMEEHEGNGVNNFEHALAGSKMQMDMSIINPNLNLNGKQLNTGVGSDSKILAHQNEVRQVSSETEDKLAQLKEMGYDNRTFCLVLLKQNNGDMDKVITDLKSFYKRK